MNSKTLMKKLSETTAQALQKQCEEYAAELKESQTAVTKLRTEIRILKSETAWTSTVKENMALEKENERLTAAIVALHVKNDNIEIDLAEDRTMILESLHKKDLIDIVKAQHNRIDVGDIYLAKCTAAYHTLRAENERLAAALRQIGKAVTPGAFNSQLENWILAQVEGVLGDE